MKIKEGDKFLCIKDVKMATGIHYTRGKIYNSEIDNYITDDFGGTSIRWGNIGYFSNNIGHYFKPLKDVDKMYTKANDRLRELHRNFTGNKIGNPDVADYFDNKDVNHEDFAFSAQWGVEEFYEEEGYDYVSEEVFIKLNGLEKPTTKEELREGYIGRRVVGFKFDSQPNCGYVSDMDDYIGVVGTIVCYNSDYNTFEVKFKDGLWNYPADIVIKQLEQEDYDEDPYNWVNNAMRKSVISNKKDEIVQNNDPINPTHYNQYAIQPLDYIEANGFDFCEGNVIKYVSRYKQKNGLEDLKKARVYLDKLINRYEK